MKQLILYILAMSFLSSKPAKTSLPDACVGSWQGSLMIYANGTLTDSVASIFTVAKLNDSTWTWHTKYLAPEPIVKDYLLRMRNAGTGHYVIDEKDGIALDARCVGHSLYSMFEVEGKMLTSTYSLLDESTLLFEITFGSPAAAKTGNGITNYTITTVQRALLRKVS